MMAPPPAHGATGGDAALLPSFRRMLPDLPGNTTAPQQQQQQQQQRPPHLVDAADVVSILTAAENEHQAALAANAALKAENEQLRMLCAAEQASSAQMQQRLRGAASECVDLREAARLEESARTSMQEQLYGSIQRDTEINADLRQEAESSSIAAAKERESLAIAKERLEAVQEEKSQLQSRVAHLTEEVAQQRALLEEVRVTLGKVEEDRDGTSRRLRALEADALRAQSAHTSDSAIISGLTQRCSELVAHAHSQKAEAGMAEGSVMALKQAEAEAVRCRQQCVDAKTVMEASDRKIEELKEGMQSKEESVQVLRSRCNDLLKALTSLSSGAPAEIGDSLPSLPSETTLSATGPPSESFLTLAGAAAAAAAGGAEPATTSSSLGVMNRQQGLGRDSAGTTGTMTSAMMTNLMSSRAPIVDTSQMSLSGLRALLLHQAPSIPSTPSLSNVSVS